MAVATTLIEDEEPARKPNAATSLYETPGYENQPSGERATTLIEDDPSARLDDLTYVPGDTDKSYDEWKEWVQGREDQDFGMDDAIAIGKTMVGELYDGGKAFIANAAEGEFRRIINSLGEGVLRGTADLGIIANKAVDKATRDDSYTRERYRGWREIRKLEAMREKARLGEEDIIDHLAFGDFQTDDVDVDPALAEGASYVTDIGTVVGGAARGAVRKGIGGALQKGQTAAIKGATKLGAKGMEVTGELFQRGKSAIAERIPESLPGYVERAARAFPKTSAAAGFVKEGLEKIGPVGSAVTKTIDELPEAPTGMGGFERASKSMALPEPIRGAASRASKGDKVLRLGKDIGLGAGYGAAAGTALSAASADTDQEFYSGVMGGALTGGIGGAGGRVIDVLTGKDDAARMQSSIREFTKEHTGNNTAWNNLLERAGSETNARETVENIVTASEMLRGRVEVKVLEGEEFNRRAGSKGVDGFYDKDTKEIVIRSDGANPRDTLLHEVGEAMWDSGVVDVGVVKNEFIKNYGNLEDLKKAYAERMLQGETEGQPTKEQIDRRVRDLDNKFKSENEDWVIRELFSENFMAESSGMGLHNFVRNNTKFGKIKRTVQALGRPLSNDVRVGKGALGNAMREVAATTFDVLGQIKGGKGIDGLGYAEGNIFGTQLKKTSKLSRAYKKYTKELNRQYKAAELGLETKRTVELNKADDAVDWDGPGKEYFDDAPAPKPKGKDKEGSQDTGGQKKAKDKKEIKQRQRDRRKSVKDNIDVNPQDTSRDVVRPQYKHDDAGNIKPNVKRELRGKFLQGTYRDLPMMENFRGTIDTVNRAIENGQVLRSTYFGTGTRQGGDTWVNSLTKDKGNIPATEVDYLPFEWLVTSAGNVDVRAIDLSYIRGRAAKWKDTGKIDDWNGDVDSFMSDAKKYLENHRDGRPGETGLSETKHKIINAFFQANNRGKNEFYTMWDRASGTRIYKSLRVERIGRAKDTSAQGTPFGMLPFDHLKVKKMQSPTRMSPARPTPDVSPSKRELDSLGMYSKAQEAIEGMQQKRGTGQQYLKALEKAGVKPEEVQDIGLDTFLKDNPKTTQEEVLDFIESNQVEMVEVTKNSRGQTLYKIEADHDDFPEFGWKSHQEAENYLKSYFEKVWLPEEIERYSAEERNSSELMEHLQEVFNDSHQISPETRGGFDIIDMWSRYGDDEPMPGSPFPSEQAALDARDAMHKEYNKAESGNFKIQRFMDLDESTRADYKSLLERFEGEYVITSQHDGQTVIESVEDALTFKDKGTAEDALYSLVEDNFYDRYRVTDNKPLIDTTRHSSYTEPGAEPETYTERLLTLPASETLFVNQAHFNEANVVAHVRHNDRIGPDGEKILFLEEIQSDWHQAGRQEGYRPEGKTPNAPFKKSWPEFSMKRMLKLAADEGYDAIAWTRGDTQNARYDLGDKITGLDLIEYDDGTYELMVRMPNEDVFKTVEHGITKDKLPDHIGKELTRRALDKMEDFDGGMRSAVLEGENLRLGGKGMRGFYDDKLPKLKVFKQTKDANGKPLKVETKAISDDLEANYVALDDTVRSKISSQGLPRYSPARTVSETYNKLIDSKKVKKLTGKDLVGMKLFPIKADLTAAGDVYSGIDSSDIVVPIELKGGPYFPLIKGMEKAGLAWANKGPGVSKIKSRMAKEEVYGVVVSMTPQSHKSNTDVSDAISQTVVAYIKSGRVDSQKLESLNKEFSEWEMVMGKGKNKSLVFPDFPGLKNPEKLLKYLNDLPFEKRAMFANKIDQAKFVEAGFPRISRILDATIQPEFRGQPNGQALLILKLDPAGDVVKLGEKGIPNHRSYDFAVKGKLVGVLEKPISAEKLFPDHYAKRGKQSYYTLDRDWPVTSVTEKVAQKFGVERYKHIKNPAQANAILQGAIGDWYEVPKTGKGSADFSLAIGEAYASPTVKPIGKKEARDMVKSGQIRVFQLGSDRSSKIFFALKSTNDGAGLEILNPINNEPGTSGADMPSILIKAIEEGATEIKTFSIPTKENPKGARVNAIESFGFKEVARLPFEAQESGVSKIELADMMRVWESQGWNKTDKMPDIVQLSYEGTIDDRRKIRQRYLQQDSSDLANSTLVKLDEAGEEQRLAGGRKGSRKRREPGNDSRKTSGNKKRNDAAMDGDNEPLRSRYNAVLEEIQSLGPDDADNLRISEGLRKLARKSLPGIKFSPERKLNDRGGAVYSNGYKFRAVQTSSRAGVRVYSDKGRRIGPVFNSVEKAQDHLERLMNN